MFIFKLISIRYENDGTKIAYDYDKKEFIDGLLCCEKCSTSFSESFEYEDGEISFELEKGCSKSIFSFQFEYFILSYVIFEIFAIVLDIFNRYL